ncbi:MAG: hypothetical protein M3Q63_00490 [bacterium]|nr:hypothetical protein [bacterium]
MSILFSVLMVAIGTLLLLAIIYGLFWHKARQEKKFIEILTVTSEHPDWVYADLFRALDQRKIIKDLTTLELDYLLSDLIDADMLRQPHQHKIDRSIVSGDHGRHYAITDTGKELLEDVKKTGTSKRLSDITMF